MSRYQTLLSRIPEEIDAVIVSSPKNAHYLSGFAFHDGYLLLTRKAAVLLTDSRYLESAEKEANAEFVVTTMKDGLALTCKPYLDEVGAKTIGYEEFFLTVHDLDVLKKRFADYTLAPIGTVIEDLRVFKDEEELSKIVSAQRIAEGALAHLLTMMTPNMTEIEVAAELEYAMRKGGAQGTSFDTIAVSGSMSAVPHGVPRNVKLEKGFLTMDFGAMYDGYCSDMTRTVCLGKADAEMKKVYETVLCAQKAAIEAATLGCDLGGLDEIARSIIAGAGYGEYFGHGLGHGVGMFIHERPSVSRAGKGTPFTAGHVITIEPGIYLPGRWGVRIEDMMVGHADSTEDITRAPKELIELF